MHARKKIAAKVPRASLFAIDASVSANPCAHPSDERAMENLLAAVTERSGAMKDERLLEALIEKRASIAGEILGLEKQLSARRAAIIHIDATLKLLDPTIKIAETRSKRPMYALWLFRTRRAVAALPRRCARRWPQRYQRRRVGNPNLEGKGIGSIRRKTTLGFYAALPQRDGPIASDANRAAYRTRKGR